MPIIDNRTQRVDGLDTLASVMHRDNTTGIVFISTVTTGTAPLIIASSTLISNLNADKLDGQEGSYYTNASNLASGTIPAARLGTGTANSATVLYGDNTWKAVVSSAWVVSGSDIYYNAGNVGINQSNPSEKLEVVGNVKATTFISTQATGTSPFSIGSTTVVSNLNADLLDGQHGSYYAVSASVLKLDQTTPQITVGTFRFPDISLDLPGSINRDANNIITSVAKTGGRTLTLTRDANGYIQTVADGTKTWTFTRTNNYISSWSVT